MRAEVHRSESSSSPSLERPDLVQIRGPGKKRGTFSHTRSALIGRQSSHARVKQKKQLLVNIARSCSHRETCHCCEGLAPVREKHAATFFLVLAGGPPKEGERFGIATDRSVSDNRWRARGPCLDSFKRHQKMVEITGYGRYARDVCSARSILFFSGLVSLRFVSSTPPEDPTQEDKKKNIVSLQ